MEDTRTLNKNYRRCWCCNVESVKVENKTLLLIHCSLSSCGAKLALIALAIAIALMLFIWCVR